MVNDERVFLIDTSAMVDPYRQFYAFDLVPSYWSKLKNSFKEGRIVILDKAWRELERGGSEDLLSKWIKENESLIRICSYKKPSIINVYAKVLQYIQTSDLYKESAIAEWAIDTVADPWIIATAKAENYIIVTEEKGSGGLNSNQKNKKAKIPDVAKAFNVEAISLFEMMRRLKIMI